MQERAQDLFPVQASDVELHTNALAESDQLVEKQTLCNDDGSDPDESVYVLCKKK